MLLPYDTSREPRGISTPKVRNTPYILTAYDVTSQEIDTRLLLVWLSPKTVYDTKDEVKGLELTLYDGHFFCLASRIVKGHGH